MIGLFVLLVVVGSLLLGGVAVAASIVLRVLLGLVLLPFRLIGLVLFVPFMILRGLAGAAVGLLMLPLILVGIVFFSVLTPLLPLLAIGAVIWLLLKASTRPRLI